MCGQAVVATPARSVQPDMEPHMSDLKDPFIQLGEQLATEKNKAFDLWSWLPSAKAAEQSHGEYFSEFTPSVGDILTEAAMFIQAECAPSAKALAEEPLYRCPCDECQHGDLAE